MNTLIMYNHANSFLLSAQRNLEERKNPDGSIEIIMIPAIINCAFSCEIFIKAILNHLNNNTSSHKIDELFNKLPTEISSFIKINFEQRDNFDDTLHAVGNAFVDWRYIYEKNVDTVVFLKFLMQLANALKKYMSEVLLKQ